MTKMRSADLAARLLGVFRKLHRPVRHLVAAFFCIITLTGAAMYGITTIFQEEIIERDAVRSADIVATQVQVSRTTFTQRVVDKLKREGFGISLDFEHHVGYVPIPAQYLRFVGSDINRQSEGLFSFNLLSKWNLHKNQGLRDDFERWAWTQFEGQDQVNPTGPIDWKPLWRIEYINGVKTLRYMIADPAVQSGCVECHNEQEQLPAVQQVRIAAGVPTGKIWKENQLLGAIEVQIPIDRMEALAASQKHVLLLLILVSFCGFAAAAYVSVRDLQQQGSMVDYFAEQKNLVQQKNELIEQKNELIESKNQELEKTNQALEHANRIQEEQRSELTRFLAVASHDLRQPMHALNIYLGALTSCALDDQPAAILENARKCARIMDNMFLELLNLSRLDAQVVKPTIEAFPIMTVLSRLSVEFAPQAQTKNVGFHVEASEAWVSSDMALVEQILSNLIANAVRYTDKGGITIACGEHGRVLRVEVRDTGIGISPAQQKNVFDEFCQIGNTNRDITKGLGLGLAIVKRLCTLLDVPISVDSAVGQGSIFAIELPRAAARASDVGEHRAPRRLQDALHGKLVVVVDDDDSILDAMRILLEQWGSSVVTAKSAREVIDVLGHSRRCPDVLVCDYRLHLSETGLDVIEKLRSEFNHEILAILITGDTAPALLQDTLSSGLTVLHKPVQADALYRALEQLMNRQP